jgi:anti-sigma B factor antagonist
MIDDVTGFAPDQAAPAITRVDDTSAVVAPIGVLDLAAAPLLRDALIDLASNGCVQLEVDLGQVTFMDSTAIGVLVGAHRRTTQAGGSLALRRPQERVRRVLDTLGLIPLFQVDGPGVLPA